MVARSPSRHVAEVGHRRAGRRRRSSGYDPRSSGSRKNRLASPSIRRAASASAGRVAGRVDRVEVDGDAHLRRPAGRPAAPARPGRDRASGGARRGPRPPRRCGRGRAHRSRSRGTPSTTARSAWSSSAPGHRARRRTSVRVVGEAGRGVPGRPAAGVLQRLRQVPVVEGEPRARCRWPAARRPAAGRSPARPGWPRRCRPAAPGARRPRTGTTSGPARPSARRRRGAVVVVAGDVAGVPGDDPTRRCG